MSHGEVAKRLTAPVLKTGRVKALVGSNPTLSAIFSILSFIYSVVPLQSWNL
jgi:hypothetical protein